MKIASLLSLVTGFCFFLPNVGKADGWFLPVNNANTRVLVQDPFTLSTSPVPVMGGKVEVLWAPLGTIDLTLFQTVPGYVPVDIGPVAGRFVGTTARIDGIEEGSTISAFVRGWTGSYTSWADALAHGASHGVSSIFTIASGYPNSIPPTPPVTIVNSGTGNGFTGLVLVPEPTACTLLLLGAVGILGMRSRK